MQPILFEIPGIGVPVYAYGFFLMVGFLAGVAYGCWKGAQRGFNPLHILDLSLILFLAGVLGARLFYYIQFYDEYFAARPAWEFFALWNGGLVWYGGLLAGTVVGLGYLRFRRLPVLKVADLGAPAIALGHAFGRLGCYFNGCCWGRPLGQDVGEGLNALVCFPRVEAGGQLLGSPPYLQHLDPQVMGQLYPALEPLTLAATHSYPVHPTQLYSSASSFLLFFVLVMLSRLRLKPGQLLCLFFILYSLQRFFVEGLRGDHGFRVDVLGAGLSVSQLTSLGLLPLGLIGLVYLGFRRRAVLLPSAPEGATTD